MHSNCRVCIQTAWYAFKISRVPVLIQDVDPSFGWLRIVQVFVAALRCQSYFCIKTIQTEALASDVIRKHVKNAVRSESTITYITTEVVNCSGSSDRVVGGPRSMKSTRVSLVSIFFMTFCNWWGGRGGSCSLAIWIRSWLKLFRTIQQIRT